MGLFALKICTYHQRIYLTSKKPLTLAMNFSKLSLNLILLMRSAVSSTLVVSCVKDSARRCPVVGSVWLCRSVWTSS